MTATVRPWYEELTDSVTALREAANEYRIARRSAQTLRDSVQLERRRLEEGRIHALPMPDTRGEAGWASQPHTRDPHADAIFELTDAYGRLLGATSSAFEYASMLFASGAAWAITQVQKGATPHRVAFERDPQDANHLMSRSFEIVGLDRYSGAPALAAAYERLADCLYSGEVGSGLAGRDYLADHEASEMHDLFAHADGTGSAAYAYGVIAESALRFALLPIRHGNQKPTVPEQPGPVDAG
ncbi:hypothetical protein [Streptomyces sp. NPDC001914]|uniref:hypothetical protein n=1 Tax=Streptomyces sp. NPDC001914 TaxID=3364623 RepID=UPI0036BB7139